MTELFENATLDWNTILDRRTDPPSSFIRTFNPKASRRGFSLSLYFIFLFFLFSQTFRTTPPRSIKLPGVCCLRVEGVKDTCQDSTTATEQKYITQLLPDYHIASRTTDVIVEIQKTKRRKLPPLKTHCDRITVKNDQNACDSYLDMMRNIGIPI